jgi:spore germination protein
VEAFLPRALGLLSILLAGLLFSTEAVAAGAAPPYQVSAWTFGDNDSLGQACDRQVIDEVDVDWYLSCRSGHLRATGDENPDFVAQAHARGLRVLATVSNWSEALGDFDPEIAATILAGKASRNLHAARIVQLCKNKGYDGIDLDWESLRAADRNRFSAFVEELAKLLHQSDKILAIAVHPKTSEPGDWSGAKAQDWKRLGAAVDEFKVMTYDYSGSWSDPGPIAPPSWARKVLSFAETRVPTAKIMMGIPFYGRGWQGDETTDYDYSGVQALVATYAPTIKRHASSREATFQYVDAEGADHIVFFQDRSALAAKLQMLRNAHPNIAGIAIWRMGGETPKFWNEIARQLR